MEVDVGKEAVKVLLSLLFGVGAGLFFEIFRLSRAVFSGRAAAVFLCDLLFWVVLSLASVLFFAGTAGGRAELYPLAAVMLGFFVFYYAASRFLSPFRHRFAASVRRRLGVKERRKSPKKPSFNKRAAAFLKKRGFFRKFFEKSSSKNKEKSVK